MTDRREDDKIDPITGIPISAAHEAIYTHIDESCSKVIANQTKLHADADQKHEQHIKERHHPSLNEIAKGLGQTPTQLMSSFVSSMQTSERIVEALDGPLLLGLDGVERRQLDKGMIAQMNDMQLQLRNGVKHKAELTTAQWTVASAGVTALGAIAVALIAGWFG